MQMSVMGLKPRSTFMRFLHDRSLMGYEPQPVAPADASG